MSARVMPFLLIITLLVTACAKAPYTGRSQLILLSTQQELALGNQAAEEILQKEPESRNPKYTKPTLRVGWRIAEAAAQPGYKWEFHVIDKDVPNAFCLPGGKVFVYTGLFEFAENDAQLAAVIGHEAAHAIVRHGAERVSAGLLAQFTQAAAQVAVSNQSSEVRQLFNVGFGVAATYGVILPFSRNQEYEADRVGLILMAKAGYHPDAAVEFWRNMASNKDKPNPPEYLSTHPSDQNSIQAIQSLIPEAMQYYRPR